MKTVKDYEDFVVYMWNYGAKKRLTLRDDFIMSTGLGGETGEVLEVLKKSKRDKKFNKDDLKKELGDVLYYLTMVARRHGLTLEEIIEANVKKLKYRAKLRARKKARLKMKK